LIASALGNLVLLAADPALGTALTQLLPFALIFAVFYFLLIRPQQTQRRKTQDLLANLKTGDKVITSGGLYGTIAGFRDSIVQLQIANQIKVEVARSAITGLQADEVEGSKKTNSSQRREQAGASKR